MLGKRKASRPLFSKQRRARRIPLTWVIVALLALLFWLVPVYGTPLDFMTGLTLPALGLTLPPAATPTPKPTPEQVAATQPSNAQRQI